MRYQQVISGLPVYLKPSRRAHSVARRLHPSPPCFGPLLSIDSNSCSGQVPPPPRPQSPVNQCRVRSRTASLCSSAVNMVKTKVFYMKKKFEGEPKLSDFELKEEELPPLKPGEILCEAVWLSVDPYMRAYMNRYPAGSKMIGTQVSKVLESKNSNFSPGELVVCAPGWVTHCIIDPNSPDSKRVGAPMKLRHAGQPPSLALGVLGMPGNTAYFGFLEICQPKAGETVVVSTAAGAVGSVVGQIARIKGCHVIGFTGSDDKVRYLKEELGFHDAFNYKTVNVIETLKKAAPKGVDCFFDNVGGAFSSEVLSCMNDFGRVGCCGSISSYNTDVGKMPLVPVIQPSIIMKQLKLEGFIVYRWLNRWNEGLDQLGNWVKEGKLKYSEKVYDGFEKLPQALIDLLRGENTGKMVIRAAL